MLIFQEHEIVREDIKSMYYWCPFKLHFGDEVIDLQMLEKKISRYKTNGNCLNILLSFDGGSTKSLTTKFHG